MHIVIHTDGGARGNPGKAAVGVFVQTSDTPQQTSGTMKTLASFGKKIGTATNNEAEYQAVIHALSYLKLQVANFQMPITTISVFLDSLLVCSQINGKYKVKQAHLQELLFQIRSLEQEIGISPTYHHIPREKNQEADKLVNKALDTV